MSKNWDAEARKRSLERLLLLLASWGVFLIVIPVNAPYAIASFVHIGRDLGIALLVAAILGWLVDRALKQDLIRDAVSASIGYLLPNSLKAELAWIYDQKFITEQTFTVRLDHRAQEKAVIFHGHYTRVIRNISGRTSRPEIHGGADEWFHSLAESEITRCGYIRNGKFTAIPVRKNEAGLGYNCGEIELDPQESIQVEMAYNLVGPESGIEILTHCYPIENPVVILDVPATLMARVTFSNRFEAFIATATESGHISRRLDGVLLPYTDIRIYWYRTDGIEARRNALDSQA
jgi:hypothetical protein